MCEKASNFLFSFKNFKTGDLTISVTSFIGMLSAVENNTSAIF